jgi:hypothetical protein
MTSCKTYKYLDAEAPTGAGTQMYCSKNICSRDGWPCSARTPKNDGPNLRELCPERKHYIQLKFLCQTLDIFIACGGLPGCCANMCHATKLDSRAHTRRPSDRWWGEFSFCWSDERKAFTCSCASQILAARGSFVAI